MAETSSNIPQKAKDDVMMPRGGEDTTIRFQLGLGKRNIARKCNRRHDGADCLTI
jgi:hypothetical protein